MTFSRYLLFLFSVVYFSSCDLEKTASLKENLPRANGKAGQIIIVMDSAQWEGKVGDQVRDIFHMRIPYLPRVESIFNLSHIDPLDFQSLMKRQKNLIFVTDLSDKSRGNRKLKSYFTSESLKMIEENPSLFMYAKQDEFARGQEVLHLFGENEAILIENLKNNKEKLQKHFEKIEGKREYQALYTANEKKGISKLIKDKLGCDLKIPNGYDLALQDDDFMWLRQFSPDVDKSIFVSWVDYKSEDLFSLDSMLQLRTKVSKPYILYKPEDKESYMLTETANFNVFRNEINFKGKYAVELRGLWRVNKYYMGGPFLSYAMVDETSNRLYYIEAFLYCPGKEQRDHMRELETILKTFDVGGKPV